MASRRNNPAVGEHLVVSFPAPHVLQLRLNRPKALNAMTDDLENDIRKTLDWAEEDASIWVVVVTGTGRAFCAGQDLKNWNKTAGTDDSPTSKIVSNPHGFGSIARRRSKKTYIAALNGFAYGGGVELLLNCDIIIGAKGAALGLPEVKRGVVASVGGIPNLLFRSPQLVPYLLTGNPMPQHILEANVFTEVVPPEQVLTTALKWAAQVVECSPDAVWVTKEQINLYKDGKGIQEIVKASMESEQAIAMYSGDNLKEGLKAFVEKRGPRWTNPPSVKSKL